MFLSKVSKFHTPFAQELCKDLFLETSLPSVIWTYNTFENDFEKMIDSRLGWRLIDISLSKYLQKNVRVTNLLANQ